MEFDHGFAEHIQDGGASCRQVIVPAAPFPTADSRFRPQPAVAFKSFEEWIERARTDVIPMTAELAQDPLADDRMLGRVMKNVNLPEPKQDLSCQQFRVVWGHQWAPGQYYDNRKRI
jgi:hypothetical protein